MHCSTLTGPASNAFLHPFCTPTPLLPVYVPVCHHHPAMILQKRVAAAMAEVRAERAASAPMDPLLQMRVRYFNLPAQAGGGSGGRGESGGGADAPQPGQISEGLAAALGE